MYSDRGAGRSRSEVWRIKLHPKRGGLHENPLFSMCKIVFCVTSSAIYSERGFYNPPAQRSSTSIMNSQSTGLSSRKYDNGSCKMMNQYTIYLPLTKSNDCGQVLPHPSCACGCCRLDRCIADVRNHCGSEVASGCGLLAATLAETEESYV